MVLRLLVSLFKFFASFHLAIFLFVSLALVFALGTFFESAYGTEAAKLLVYRNPWLSGFLILLALNVAAATLDRLPWKRKHIGFVVTHAGILLLLAGSLVTRTLGVEGQVALEEGKTAERVILNEALLQIFSDDSGPLGSFSIPPRAFPWQGKETLSRRNPKVWLRQYYPKAQREEKIEASSNGPPALHVVLESSFMKTSHWLVLDDPARGEIHLGPAQLRFARESIPPFKKSPEEGSLEFQFENAKPLFLPIPPQTDPSKKIPLPGTPYAVRILRLLKDARVEEGELVDQSENGNNPACELILEGKGLKERHLLFAHFPDFPTLHGLEPSQTGVRIYYRRPQGNPDFTRNELRFIWQKEGLPAFQVRQGERLTEEVLELGKNYETGWMDFKFRVERYYPHARIGSAFSKAPVQSEAPEHFSALEIGLEEAGEEKLIWLGEGAHETLELGGRTFHLIYGLRTLPLGFRIGLRDFRVETYPGTSRPASFESDVTLRDEFTGAVREVTIRMNQPLKHRGLKVFQSGYQQPEGQPEVSIFTVTKDPGIPLKYAGSVVLIGGILLMFYTRRESPQGILEAREWARVS